MTNIYPVISVKGDRRDASSFIKYDHYLDDSSREIFKDGSKPLREFLKMRSMVATPPCDSIRAGRLFLAGDLFQTTKGVATEFGRKFTRSFLKGLRQNELNHESFSDFKPENMFASRSGKVKLYGVKRVKRTGVQAKRNYDSAHDIIKGLFSKGGAIPEDIQHLLGLIKGYPAKSGLYHIHGSLIPLSKRQAAYFKMYEQLTCIMSVDQREKILLKLPYIEEWRDNLKNNRLLERAYHFKPGMYDVTEPLQDGQLLTFEQLLEQGRKRKGEESENMVKYMRHKTAHRMEQIEEEKELGKPPYKAEDSELVALVRYPLSLPRLQEELYDAKQFADLQMDELF